MAPFPAVIELSSLDGNNGFQINGEEAGDQSGWSVALAGDVNGDGFADLMIGAPEEHYSFWTRRELRGLRHGRGLCRRSRPLNTRRQQWL